MSETVLVAEQDSVWLLDEESGQSLGVPLAAIVLEIIPQQVTMPTPPSEGEGDQVTESP